MVEIGKAATDNTHIIHRKITTPRQANKLPMQNEERMRIIKASTGEGGCGSAEWAICGLRESLKLEATRSLCLYFSRYESKFGLHNLNVDTAPNQQGVWQGEHGLIGLGVHTLWLGPAQAGRDSQHALHTVPSPARSTAPSSRTAELQRSRTAHWHRQVNCVYIGVPYGRVYM